jgi:hypothetical protein
MKPDFDPLFREEQRFRQPWLWVLVVASLLLVIATFLIGVVQQLVLGRPWGNNPMSDTGLVVTALLVTALCAGILILYGTMKLVVEVRQKTVHVKFRPFVTYHPIRDYGGWGIRFSLTGKGRAYNVSGNRGVLLTLSNGKRLMLGSQRAEELASAIATAKG